MAIIYKIQEESIAEELGIKAGDELLAVNNKQINDYIDFKYETADTFFTLTIKRNNEIWDYEIAREPNENLGIEFEEIIFDKLKLCHNDCLFCFVKQQPSNLRDSLLKKDDDYRFSFLQGSFITLTNLSNAEFDNIIRKRLSPLNISVHTTNPKLREKMMKNPNAGNIYSYLKRLSQNGINFNAQIVLCPDLNDGAELDRTINDLQKLFPAIKSLGIVPVGLTNHRDNLFQLRTFADNEMKKVVRQIEKWQEIIRKNTGQNFLYAADEFYLSAGLKIPEYNHYDDFPQIENGIGLTRLLWKQLSELETKIPEKIEVKQNLGIITGELGLKAISPVVQRLNEIENLILEPIVVENHFFGGQVNVTGLLTGSDILTELNNLSYSVKFDKIIIPDIVLNEDNYFLDDMHYNHFKKNGKDLSFALACDINEILEVIGI